jgi:hypothetical protein
MNPIRIAPVTAPMVARTGERQGGARRGDTDAFRRAMQEHQAEKQSAREQESAPKPAAVRPMPPALQRQAIAGRKDQQPLAQHVDVIA